MKKKALYVPRKIYDIAKEIWGAKIDYCNVKPLKDDYEKRRSIPKINK